MEEADGRDVLGRYLLEYLTFHDLRNTLEGTVSRSCPLGRDLQAWRLLNLQPLTPLAPLAPLAALAGRPPKETMAQSRKHTPARQVGSQDARRIENGV